MTGHEFSTEMRQAAKRFCDAAESIQQAFRNIANAVRPAVEAVTEFFRKFKSNRRIRLAIQMQRWSKAGWYIADHRRRSEARTLRVGAGGEVGVAETAEGGTP